MDNNPHDLSTTRRPVRCALYARSSTNRQEHSTGAQLDSLRAVAQQRSWSTASEFVDAAQSGARDRRPQLDELMRLVHRGGVDVVVVTAFDRFARSVRHLITALDDFRARGVQFVSVREGIDTSTPSGRFTFSVIAAVCDFERELIRERTKAGLAVARRRGAVLGRPRVHVDLARARELLAGGSSVRGAARSMGIGAATLSRALSAASHELPDPSETPNIMAAATAADVAAE